MIDLKLDKSTGPLDLVIVNGSLQTVEGTDAEAQALEFKLEFFVGDWFMDLAFGIPYYGRVFQRGINITDLEGVFRFAMEEEPYIQRVDKLDLIIDAQLRILKVEGEAFSKSGELINFTLANGA